MSTQWELSDMEPLDSEVLCKGKEEIREKGRKQCTVGTPVSGGEHSLFKERRKEIKLKEEPFAFPWAVRRGAPGREN